jgi:hypothetical protein
VPSFNRGKWAELEDLIRTYAEETGHHICVISGPLFLNEPEQKIGRNVWIPDACFKAVFDAEASVPVSAAFIMPNKKGCLPPGMYAVTVDSLEKLTRTDFFTGISQTLQYNAESVYVDSVWMKGRWKGTHAPIPTTLLPFGYINTMKASESYASRLNVCGKLVDWVLNDISGDLILSLDQKAQNPVCTVLIREDVQKTDLRFSPNSLSNHTICAKGDIVSYKGMPQINLKTFENLKEMETLRR